MGKTVGCSTVALEGRLYLGESVFELGLSPLRYPAY